MFIKKNITNYIVLLFSIILSLGAILIFESLTIHILAFWLVVIVAILIVKFDISHPLVWFSASFALYSTAYGLTYILGYVNILGYSKNNLLYPFIAMCVVLLIVGIKNYGYPKFHKQKTPTILNSDSNKKLVEYILVGLLLVLLLSSFSIFLTPFEHKNDLLSTSNLFFRIGTYSTRFICLFCCFYLLLFIDVDKRKSIFFIISAAILVISFSMVTGERDAMLRFLVIIIMTLFMLEKLSKKTILLLIPIGSLFLIVQRYLKYFFVSGEVNEGLEESSFLYNFLSSDFGAPGQNLQMLLNNPWTESIHDFRVIITDFIGAFLPGGIFTNVGVWFNETFYPNSYSRAFTLVGEGYVISGLFGIILLFLLVAIFTKLLYLIKSKSIYWALIYIYFIPTLILAFRSTLGILFTDLIRVAIFGLFIHFLLLLLIENKTNIKFKKLKTVK